MDLTSKRVIKGLFKKYQIRPSKRLGQNFLIDKSVIKKNIRASNIQPKDIILEIGPGMGVLTQELAKKSQKVIAVEKDPKMCEILKETLKDFKNVEIINQDILKFNNYSLLTTHYKLIASLPFYITASVIRKFLESEHPPEEMILMVQKEVAQRICAKSPKMNLLAVSVQFYAEPKIIFYISKKSFWPSPKVDGAILQISRIRTNLPRINTNLFFKVVKAGFSQPRKQLANNLVKGLALSSPNGLALSSPNGLKLNKEQVNNWLLKSGIQPSQRAETLTIRDWINLTRSIEIK